MWTIYHNSNCSKSNAAFDLLKDKGVEFQIINYIENPPSVDDLKTLCAQLNNDIEAMVRKKEEGFLAISEQWDDWTLDQKLEFLSQNSQLMERPILVNPNNKAKIGRPDHTVLFELFED